MVGSQAEFLLEIFLDLRNILLKLRLMVVLLLKMNLVLDTKWAEDSMVFQNQNLLLQMVLLRGTNLLDLAVGLGFLPNILAAQVMF